MKNLPLCHSYWDVTVIAAFCYKNIQWKKCIIDEKIGFLLYPFTTVWLKCIKNNMHQNIFQHKTLCVVYCVGAFTCHKFMEILFLWIQEGKSKVKIREKKPEAER